MKIVTCLPEAARKALVFHADPCEYVYDSDPRINPQRIFQWGPEKKWAQDGHGFPYPGMEAPNLPGLRSGRRGYLNAEHSGPDFRTVVAGRLVGELPLPMRAKGVETHGTREGAERALAMYLTTILLEIKGRCGEAGAYNFYPFDGISDARALVLSYCDVWSPPLYVNHNGSGPVMNLPLAPTIMPPKPIVPIVRLDANDGDMLGQGSWTSIFHYSQKMGAREMMLWGTSDNLARTAKASQFMRNGAIMAGVTLEPKGEPGPKDEHAPTEPAE